MKLPRRLDAVPDDVYQRARRSRLRHVALSEAAFQALPPEHVIVEDASVLIGQPYQGSTIRLQYGFASADAFVRDFPGMFDRLISDFSLDDAPLGLRLRLTDAPSRPYVEPVLIQHAFRVIREWLRMELLELPDGGPPDDAVAQGFTLRQARPDDADTLVELDAAAFAKPALTPNSARDVLQHMPVVRVLEDEGANRAVGLLLLRVDPQATGYISEVALLPDYQRRGLGEAMMRWAFAWFRERKLRRSALTVSLDNGPAIALYRKLGFVPGETGLDYRRPIDEDEVRQVMEKNLAQRITVRRRTS